VIQAASTLLKPQHWAEKATLKMAAIAAAIATAIEIFWSFCQVVQVFVALSAI